MQSRHEFSWDFVARCDSGTRFMDVSNKWNRQHNGAMARDILLTDSSSLPTWSHVRITNAIMINWLIFYSQQISYNTNGFRAHIAITNIFVVCKPVFNYVNFTHSLLFLHSCFITGKYSHSYSCNCLICRHNSSATRAYRKSNRWHVLWNLQQTWAWPF